MLQGMSNSNNLSVLDVSDPGLTGYREFLWFKDSICSGFTCWLARNVNVYGYGYGYGLAAPTVHDHAAHPEMPKLPKPKNNR